MKKEIKKSSKFSSILGNSKGVILPQLIVTAAVIGAISVSVMNYTRNASKSAKYEAEKISKKNLIEEFKNVLRSKSACSSSFAGARVTDASINTLHDGSNLIINLASADRNLLMYGSPGTLGVISIMSMELNGLLNHGAVYTIKSGPNAGQTRQVGKFFLKVTFKKGIHYTAAGAEIVKTAAQDLKATQSTLSFVKQTKLIPIMATYNPVNSVIAECISMSDLDNAGKVKTTKELVAGTTAALNSEMSTYCLDLFEGDATQDGRCRHITVYDNAGTGGQYAATLGGNVTIQQSDFSTGNDLFVEGSLSTGRVQAATGIAPGTDGAVAVDLSMAVGSIAIVPPAANGAAHFETSIGIGEAPPAATGSIEVNLSASFGPGMSPSTSGGNVSIEGSMRTGSGANASTPAVGNLYVEKRLAIGGAPVGAAGHVKVYNSMAVGRANESAGSIAVEGHVNIPNQTVTDNEPTHAASQQWVAQKIANTLNPGSVSDVAAIFADIMAANPNEAGVAAFCKGTRTNNLTGTVSANSQFSSGICNMVAEYCSKDGECAGVYAEADGVKSGGDIKTSSGSIQVTRSGGKITSDTGEMKASTIRAKSNLCLNGVCKSSWGAITKSHGTCSSHSSGYCSSSGFVVRVAVNKSNFTYPTSFSSSGAWGVTSSSTTKSVVNSISYTCCKMENDD